MALLPSQKGFYDDLWPQAQRAGAATGIDPAIIFAQSALETGWGKSAPNNNYFGIKGSGGTQTTKEYINGKWVTIKDSFAGYSSVEDSVTGYIKFMTENPRYSGVIGATSIEGQIAALGNSGYATDPNYAAKISAIVDMVKTGNVGDIVDKSIGVVTGAYEASKDALGGVVDKAKEGIKNPLDSVTAWLKEFFSINTAARFSGVIIGIILIGLAIWALMNSADK